MAYLDSGKLGLARPSSLQGLAGNKRPAGPAWEPKEGSKERSIRVQAKHSPDIRKTYPWRLERAYALASLSLLSKEK